MACGFGLALRSLLYHIQSRSARFATFQQFSSLVSVAQNEMKIWYRKSYFYDCSSSIRHKLLQLPLQKAMKCHNLGLINNFPVLRWLLGSSRKSCALCVCVIQASHTKTALCLFVKLLKQLQHQELRPFLTTGLWDVPSMANLWNQSCSVGKNFPVWLWKFSRASPPFYSYKFSPVWWGVLTPIWNTATQTCVHKCIYRTRYLLHSRHLKFYIF